MTTPTTQPETTSPETVGEWFDEKYAVLLAERASTMREALVRLHRSEGRLIVETGCARDTGSWRGDGQSTLIFVDYGLRYGAAVVSIDTDPQACLTAKRNVAKTFGTRANYTCINADGVEALKHLNPSRKIIDLLYLDSLDFDAASPEPSQRQALEEFRAAEPWLGPRSLLLIDDCDQPHGGKGGLVIPYMQERGWSVIEQGKQALLCREVDGW